MDSNRVSAKSATRPAWLLRCLGALAVGACGEPDPQEDRLEGTPVLLNASPSARGAASPPARGRPQRLPLPPSTLDQLPDPRGPSTAQYRGCRAIRDTPQGPVCVQSATSQLVIWLAAPDCDALEITENDKPVSFEHKPAVDGCQLRPTDLSTQPQTTLRIKPRNSRTSPPLLTLLIDRSMPDFMAGTDRLQARADVDVDPTATEHYKLKTKPLRIEDLIDSTFRQALAHSRRGENELAIRAFREVHELAVKAGYRSIAFDAACLLIGVYEALNLLNEAKSVLQSASSLLTPGYSYGRLNWAWEMGLILREEERLGEAAEWIRRALKEAERVDDVAFARAAIPILIDLLVRTDHRKEALKLQPMLAHFTAQAEPCDKAKLLTSQGWLALLLSADAQEGSTVLGDQRARDLFMQALSLNQQCPDLVKRGNILTGLAQTAFAEHRPEEAHEWMEKARKIQGLHDSDRMDLIEIEGRLLLQQGHPREALYLFQSLLKSAQENQSLQQTYTCRAVVGSLEAIHSLRQTDSDLRKKAYACAYERTDSPGPAEVRQLQRRARAVGLVR